MITENKDEITIYDVISKKKEVSRKADTKLIMKAYNLAAEKHKDQKRGSGKPVSYTHLTLPTMRS